MTTLDRLRAVRRHGQEPQTVSRPQDLPAYWREVYEERAAIREFCGGQSREEAEAGALAEVEAMRAQEARNPDGFQGPKEPS